MFIFAPDPTPESTRVRPGVVTDLCGVIIQCDDSSLIGEILIRPLEWLDLRAAGLGKRHGRDLLTNRENRVSLGMHAGLHVILDDGRHFVVEQLAGGWRDLFLSGLHWTPLESFQGRQRPDKGGWDATVPAEKFRQLDESARRFAVTHLNSIRGLPFMHEDCTGFIGRVFGTQRRVFADSPILRSLGFDFRSGEPALPLIFKDAVLDSAAEDHLEGEVLRALPDPVAESNSMSLRQLHHRVLIGGALFAAMVFVASLFVPATKKTARD